LSYPEGFVERCIATLVEKDAASVVVPMATEGRSCMQRAIAAAQNSRLGNGGSAHRLGNKSGYVDHGHHAAFDRKAFSELGGYDETFTHNEDAEYDRRVTASGRRIYLDCAATIVYYPRAKLQALARQYFAYGWGRASTIAKHAFLPRLRQMLPVAVLVANLIALGLATLDLRYLAIPLAYMAACIMWGLGLAVRRRETCLALSGLAAMVMHMSWAGGFLAGLVASMFRKRQST
jgi:succinoglycan biosynthesis protein ExoA